MNLAIDHLSENCLYHIWDGSHLRLNELRSSDGTALEIIHRGQWNTDAGPDFMGAIIRFDGELRQGDVEIHIRESEWFLHKHHLDPGYNQVILHAVLWRSPTPMAIVSQAGQSIPTLVMSHYLDEAMDLKPLRNGGTPPARRDWPEFCPLGTKSNRFIRRRIREWGLQRLREKMQRFAEQRGSHQFDDLLYQGLCAALGYSKNQRPFSRLARILSLDRIRSMMTGRDDLTRLQGVFLGTAGFLDDRRCHEHLPAAPEVIREFTRHWHVFRDRYRLQGLACAEWRFFRLRPANFATFRLAGLCQLLLRWRNTGLFAPVLHAFRTLKGDGHRIFCELARQYQVAPYGPWRAGSAQDKAPIPEAALIGPARAREIVVNVVLPLTLAYALEAEEYSLAALVRETYLLAPKLQSNIVTRSMAAQLALPGPARAINACEHQGLIHMAGRLCPNWRCHECIHGPDRRSHETSLSRQAVRDEFALR